VVGLWPRLAEVLEVTEAADEVRRLRTALYGDDITTGDIPVLKHDGDDIKRRLTRAEWALVAIIVATGANGVGTLVGTLT
jgi:hypothetical protein